MPTVPILCIFLFIASCEKPALTHGSIFHAKRCKDQGCPWVGATYFLQCNPNYHLSGYGFLRCVGYGRYNLPIPSCKGKNSKKSKKNPISSVI